MKISYLVTCSDETDTLDRLLYTVLTPIRDGDEVIVLKDVNNSINTENIIKKYLDCPGFLRCTTYLTHSLNNDYGAHKNFGIEKCSGDWIYQIDGDELPSDYTLGDNLISLIEANPTTEAYAVPRINDFRGVTPEHALRWGWRLSTSKTYNRPMVNFPDWQFRIFKKDYPRISYLRRLHEKIEGYKTYVLLPAEEEYALYHDKTIEQQEQTNIRYNEKFTVEENKGHNPV